ncbi:TolC family protein [candidate division WOR-3 bacterium]|nr:TolC family protein [candidate division WOR-3 bacterium]
MIWITMFLLAKSYVMTGDTLKINLEQAKQMAIKSNPGYKIDALSHTYSKLGLYKKLSSNILNPEVSVNYSEVESPDAMLYSAKGYSFNFSLNQRVLDLGQVTSLLGSKFEKNANGALREESENRLFYEVESCYLSVLKSQKLVELKEKAVERANENMRLVSKKLEVGEASKLDSLNAEVSLNRAKLDGSGARKNYELAKRILLNALGIFEERELLLESVKEVRVIREPLLLDSLVASALEERPSVKAEREALKGGKLGFYGSILSFLPAISFKWWWGYRTEDFPERFSEIRDGANKSSGWNGSIGLNLFTYPFEVWQFKTALDKAKLSLLSKELNIVREVKDAWLLGEEAHRNLKLAESMWLAAEEAYKLSKHQYELGLISALDFFRVAEDKLDAEISYVNTKYDYKLAYTRLQYVTGK